jgi:PAS domain S-box-containing protein
MRIRSQLTASAVLAGLVTVLVAVGLSYVSRQAQSGLDEQADSEQVARHVANMLSLTNEFTLYGGERAVAQWRSRQEQLLAALGQAMRRRDPPSPPLAELQRNVGNLSSLFDKLVELGPEPATPLAQGRRDLLIERLLTEMQGMVESRHRWAIAIGEAQQKDQRLYTAMLLAVPVLLLILLTSLGTLVRWRVLRPLARLQATVTAIRDGNLGVRCDTGVRDELGDAARAIDAMTTTLQMQGEALLVSNQSLSREVTGRRDSEERLRLVTDNMPALLAYLDRDQRFQFANRGFRDWLGIDPAALAGRSLADFYGEPTYSAIRPHIDAALAGQPVTYERELATPAGLRYVQVSIVPQRDASGAVLGLFKAVHDITGRKLAEIELAERQSRLEASLHEKEVLLREIHHRVKNNMQVISSLLQLQSDNIDNPEARELFAESQNRIRSMALIHEKLYQSDDLAQVDFADYVESLVSMLRASQGARAPRVSLDVRTDPVAIDIERAIPAGLILNELVSNCFKHGFPDGRQGRIEVRLHARGGEEVALAVRDDGVAPPPGFDPSAVHSLGLRLVHILADQLGATLAFDHEQGFACDLAFKLNPRRLPARPD